MTLHQKTTLENECKIHDHVWILNQEPDIQAVKDHETKGTGHVL
jgi:hypothetical protein